MSAHCEGCGTPEGQVVTTWHDKRNEWGEVRRIARDHAPAVLLAVDLPGFSRRLCQVCHRHAHARTANVAMFGVASPGGTKKRKPDPRQLDLCGDDVP